MPQATEIDPEKRSKNGLTAHSAGSLPLGPGGHTNQQDRIQSIRGKTKIISLGEILKGEVLKGEVLKDKPRQKLTRPGRLRARSGSKLPEASIPHRAWRKLRLELKFPVDGSAPK